MTFKEKRQEIRIQQDGDVSILLNDTIRYTGSIGNLSPSGALLHINFTENWNDQETSIKLQFTLPNSGDDYFVVDGAIMHWSKDSNTLNLGVRFSDQSQAGIMAIKEFIKTFHAYF